VKMTKVSKLLFAAGLVLSSIAVANAQSKFEGAYGQIGIGYESINPSFSSGGLSIGGVGTVPISTTVSTSSGFTGALGVGYYASLSKDFLLGLGVEYDPLNSSSANYTYGINGYGTVTGSYKKQNAYNIFLSPATPIGTDGLLYGKVGYTGASIQATDNGGSAQTTNYTGYSLGLGYKQLIQGGLYAFGEVNYMSYGNVTNTYSGKVSTYTYSYSNTSSANTFNALIGVGYKF